MSDARSPEVLPAGPDGVLVRFGLTPDPDAMAAAQVLAAELQDDAPAAAVEIAPALVSVLVRFDPGRTDRGAVALNDYARANDPFANVGRVQVAVDVSSVIRASPDSFRVAWTERRYQDGSLAATERWSAILTIVVQPPRTPDALRKNPLGVFVNALNWSRELSQ